MFWLTDEEARRAKAWIAAGLPDVSALAQKADETGRLQAVIADMRRINSDLYAARNQCLDDLDEAEETIRRLREELARAQAEIARLQNLLART